MAAAIMVRRRADEDERVAGMAAYLRFFETVEAISSAA
jgi:hypothetical protein